MTVEERCRVFHEQDCSHCECLDCCDNTNEVGQLRRELAELLEEAFREIATEIPDGPMAGWWDSNARSTACAYGDRLVELGLWERHPDGYGRRQFYRPLQSG